ncbi:MAG: EF2563 family selenium-dependent molybdenum hydroxylase system protein [Ruminococcus sp.]|nr:EF2563 family selenium-dependent molybdenum hydroxylase system protein [Ruminococcus sp.]
MLAVIKGAGDIASGIALRLHRANFKVVMTEIDAPSAIRRTVCFSEAVYNGEAVVEDVKAVLADNTDKVAGILENGNIAVLVDERANCIKELKPDFVIDAILAKKNIGTDIDDAPVVIGVGPGFTAKEDCHAVVETKRGHFLGRVYYEGSAIENTGIPGDIAGYTTDRIIRSPEYGVFNPIYEIGDEVKKGEVVACVDSTPIVCNVSGILRGILPKGTLVSANMKSGDVDPRCDKEHCYTVSDKALAVGGGVLEACLHLHKD